MPIYCMSEVMLDSQSCQSYWSHCSHGIHIVGPKGFLFCCCFQRFTRPGLSDSLGSQEPGKAVSVAVVSFACVQL